MGRGEKQASNPKPKPKPNPNPNPNPNPKPKPKPNPNPNPNQATQTFAVTSTSTTLGSAANPRAELRTQTRVEHFDYVVCASGHYSTPNSPHFDGLENFHGRVMHAHDLKDATEFKGQHVLIIGTSYSAEDIASQVGKI